MNCIVDDFNSHNFNEQFDCVWCSHVLEHQLNVQIFLEKINRVLKEGGILAITVPPLINDVVGGHVSLWNAGTLLYRLVLAGFDCREAHIKTYSSDISIIVKKKSIRVLDKIVYDNGDLITLHRYFPPKLKYKPYTMGVQKDIPFEGNIHECNW